MRKNSILFILAGIFCILLSLIFSNELYTSFDQFTLFIQNILQNIQNFFVWISINLSIGLINLISLIIIIFIFMALYFMTRKKVYVYDNNDCSSYQKFELNDVHTIKIDMFSCDITIKENTEQNIAFEFVDFCKLDYTTLITNGVLEVSSKLINTNFVAKMILYIPNCDKSIKIETKNGDIEIDDVNLKNINFKTFNGDIDVMGNYESVKIETMNGDLDISYCIANEIEAKTLHGDIVALNVDANHTHLGTLHGDISLFLNGAEHEYSINQNNPNLKYVYINTLSGDVSVKFRK